MVAQRPTPSRRVATSDDLEVSTYLEIAREKEGAATQPGQPSQRLGEGIAIIDFGSQYSHLIALRIRELNVYSEVVSHDAPWSSVEHINPRGIILSGGPNSVYDDDAPLAPHWVYDSGLPFLCICY